MKRLMILLLVFTGPVCVVWPITHEYSRQITILSDKILFKAQELADTTDSPVFRSDQAEAVLAELSTRGKARTHSEKRIVPCNY